MEALNFSEKSETCINKSIYKVIKVNGKFIVALAINDNEEFLAKLEGVTVKKEFIDGQRHLTLTASKCSSMFQKVAIDFLDYFVNNEDKRSNPQEWVDCWEELIGNKISKERIYDVYGELLVLRKLLEKGYDAKLTNKGTIDIETPDTLFEVKTTLKKHGESITINSEFQLEKLDDRKIYLEYVKLEESEQGESINSLIRSLEMLGYNIENIKIRCMDISTKYRIQKYKELEIREYLVDENFPKVTKESFVDGKLPVGISKLTYEVDLTGINYNAL